MLKDWNGEIRPIWHGTCVYEGMFIFNHKGEVMSKWIKSARWICIVCVLGAAGNIFAQEDKLIENQRTNIIHNTEWGDTYLGKYTPNNSLVVSNSATLISANAYVGVSDLATSNTALVTDGGTWTMDSLQIGSTNNSGNTVTVQNGGTIEIDTGFSILGSTNGNMLTLGSGGTLYMKSDFDAEIDGFVYGSNNTLKVGGELSNLDHIENQRKLVLSGGNAAWDRSTNVVFIGENTSGNSLSLESGAQLSFTNISIGSIATTNNAFIVSSGSQATVASNLSLKGTASYVEVSGSQLQVEGNLDVTGVGSYIGINGGYLTANGNLNSENNVQFSGEGELLALGNVEMPGIDGSGLMILSGENARWTNNTSLQIGPTQGGSILAVEDNALVQTEKIEIGGVSSSGSSVVLGDQGKMILTGNGSVLYGGNLLVVDNGGWLTFGSDFSTALTWTDTNIVWNTGGTIEFQGEAPVIDGWDFNGEYLELGTLFLGEGRTMILNGSNAYLPAHTNNFHLGDLSSDNNFVVTNGARASFKTVSIGDFKEGGNNNTLLVSGNSSVVSNLGFTAIGGTMIANTWHEGGKNNILRIEDGALFYSPDTLHNRNTTGTSGLEIASGALVDVDNYYQSSGAYLSIFTDSTGTNTGLLRVSDTAEFEAGATLGFDAIASLDIDTTYTNRIVEAGTLVVDGVTNATTTDLSALNYSGGLLVNYELWVDGQNIYAGYTRNNLLGSGDSDSMIDDIWGEINRLADHGNAAASNQLDIVNNMGSEEEAKLQMEQMYSYQIPTYMHNQGVFGGINQVRARGASFHGAPDKSALPRPKGVAGPHAEDQGLQGWAKVYGNFGSRDKDDGSGFVDGYDAQAFGTVIGFDQAFGDWLFGLAGGYAGSTLDGDNGDKSDAATGYGMLYANYGTKDWFGDLIVSYGLTDMDNTSGTDFDVASSVEASQTAFYIGGGYQFEDEPSGSLFRPLLGLQVSQFDQDAYTEESPNALAKDVDAYDRLSVQSSFGASLVFPKAGKKMDMELHLRTYWLHEFNDDEEQVGYALIDSGLRGQFVMRSPDSDTAQLGAGFVMNARNGWQLRADIDVLLSQTFASTTLSGALLYEF